MNKLKIILTGLLLFWGRLFYAQDNSVEIAHSGVSIMSLFHQFAISNDGKYAVINRFKEDKLEIWDAHETKRLFEISSQIDENEKFNTYWLGFSNDAEFLIHGGNLFGSGLYRFDIIKIEDRSIVNIRQFPTTLRLKFVRDRVFIPNKNHNKILEYDLITGDSLLYPFKGSVIDYNNNFIAYEDDSLNVFLFDKTRKESKLLTQIPKSSRRFNRNLIFSPNGEKVAVKSEVIFKVFDLRSDELLLNMKDSTFLKWTSANAMAFSSDSRKIFLQVKLDNEVLVYYDFELNEYLDPGGIENVSDKIIQGGEDIYYEENQLLKKYSPSTKEVSSMGFLLDSYWNCDEELCDFIEMAKKENRVKINVTDSLSTILTDADDYDFINADSVLVVEDYFLNLVTSQNKIPLIDAVDHVRYDSRNKRVYIWSNYRRGEGFSQEVINNSLNFFDIKSKQLEVKLISLPYQDLDLNIAKNTIVVSLVDSFTSIIDGEDFSVIARKKLGGDVKWLNDSLVSISDFSETNFYIWNINDNSIKTYSGHNQNANRFAFYEGFIISISRNHVLKIWDYNSTDELVSIVSLDGSIVYFRPNGLFDTDSKGMGKLYLVKGKEIMDLKQLKDRFYEPGLFKKVLGLSDEPLRDSRGLNDIELYPDVKLGALNNKQLLPITLTNQGGGIGKVKIFINGKEVASDARGPGVDPDAKTVMFNYDIEDHPYLIPGEENEITVQAYNKEGYLVSRGASVTYTPEEENNEPPSLYGIVVGSSNYRGDQLDLKYAAKDAHDFSEALELIGDRYFEKDRVTITTLTTDNEDFGEWPTKENIENVFNQYSTSAGPEDVLVVYMSGHGTNYGGVEGDFYYLTSDANNSDLKDPAIRQSVAISSDEWTELIKTVPALKQVMVIDACHSGQLADDIMAERADRSSAEIRALERMKDRTGMYILAGSAADAVSYETSVYGQGLLTYSLLQGIKGAALREEKFVDVMQLFEHAASTVPQLAENIGGIQKPEVRVPYGGGSFDIGLVDEDVKEAIVLPSPKPIFLRSSFENDLTFNDDLNLSEQLDARLRDLSARGGEEQSIIFVDARKYSDAYSLKGRYTKTGEKYLVDVRLFKGDEMVERMEITTSENLMVSKIMTDLLIKIESK